MNDDLSNNGIKKYLSEKVARSAIFIIVNLAFVIVASIFVGYEPAHLAIKRKYFNISGTDCCGSYKFRYSIFVSFSNYGMSGTLE